VASGPSSTAPFYFLALFGTGTFSGQSDAELLARFASRRCQNDEKAELAFATLLARHGPMVLRVCRAELRDRHEAEFGEIRTWPVPEPFQDSSVDDLTL